MFDDFEIKLTLLRDQLGTNPCDPNILDKHIIQKQRSLILEKSKINKEVNKYLDAIEISQDKGEEEVNKLIRSLEEISGIALSPEEKALALRGDLEALRETFKSIERTGTTVFFWDEKTNKPCIGDHMIYGFLKAAAEAIGRSLPRKNSTPLKSIAYTQSLINQHVKCAEQFIPFDRDVKRDEHENIVFLQRSLRALTAQGPRISLAKSEVVEAGASLKFTLRVLKGSPLLQKVDGVDKLPLFSLFDYGQIAGLGQWKNAGYGQFKYEYLCV